MNKWFPDAKVLAGGLGSVVAWIVVTAVNSFTGATIGMEAAVAAVGAVAPVVAYLVPDSVEDIARKVDRYLESLGSVENADR